MVTDGLFSRGLLGHWIDAGSPVGRTDLTEGHDDASDFVLAGEG
jgi:hypothetical protein